MKYLQAPLFAASLLSLAGCGTDDRSQMVDDEGGEPAPTPDLHQYAGGCFSVQSGGVWLTQEADATEFGFSAATEEDAARFYLKASDLGTYLFYDRDGGYVVSDDGPLLRRTTLQSDVLLVDDDYISGAEWEFEGSGVETEPLQFRSRRVGSLLGLEGLVSNEENAASLALVEVDGCTEHPELTLDAEGSPTKTTFDDGDLYGIVDTHSHILTNWAFGGGGIFHGAPFHRLGVQHALADCDVGHGIMGRQDFFGYVFDTSGSSGADLGSVLLNILAGELSEDNHETDGYPTFTEWPNAPSRSTHQMQYYRWLERAHLGGLRLVVQHATTNSVICHLTGGSDIQPTRYSCDDMVAVDRIIDESYAMERYIDAQAGGPGEGFFRIVATPEEAREVIEDGKMAVVLGIETSDLFDCRLVPREGTPVCDEAYVVEQLDKYVERGVRVLFPVHKYDNLFSSGDGDRAFIEVGNFFNTGHWSNFVTDCPTDVPAVFDNGSVEFGGLNMPRDEYVSMPPNDFSLFPTSPISTAFPFISSFNEPALEGAYCQKTGLTPLGEFLIEQMMARGMVLEVDHLPQRSYERAFEMLEENDYPAVGTHGSNNNGRLYALGGVSKTGFGRCRDTQNPGSTLSSFKSRIAQIEGEGGYPAEGFGFDLNGFAGARKPRFGDNGCGSPQEDPITYPFQSVAGDITFTQPVIGERTLDFNTEGLVHIGLLPELIEDARGDAASDDELEPLFRSAEGYIRMWEKAVARGAVLGG